jgi:hypothetical protein
MEIVGRCFLTMPAAVSGYPHITVPCGKVYDLPVGFLLVPVYSESKLTSIAYAYEQASKERVAPSFKKSFSITIDSYKSSSCLIDERLNPILTKTCTSIVSNERLFVRC